MIRLTYLLRRKPGMSLESFQDYWRLEHGPLVAGHAGRLDLLAYVQVHTIPDEDHGRLTGRRGEMEPPYDGVSEMWWESREALAAATRSESGQVADHELIADERSFIDVENSPMWFNYEYPQVNPTPENIVATDRSSLVKLYFPLRHRPDLTLDSAQLYWRTHHGPIIRRQAAGSGILRYVQVHRAEPELTESMRTSRRSTAEVYTGHAEVWMDRAAMGRSTPERRVAARRA